MYSVIFFAFPPSYTNEYEGTRTHTFRCFQAETDRRMFAFRVHIRGYVCVMCATAKKMKLQNPCVSCTPQIDGNGAAGRADRLATTTQMQWPVTPCLQSV